MKYTSPRAALWIVVCCSACKSDLPASSSAAEQPATPAADAPAAPPPAGAAPAAGPHGSTPGAVAPQTLEKLPDGRRALGPFSIDVPADWVEKPSTSNMRAAQFQLPAASGEAELIVYYFGEAGAGSVEANIDRWLSQFQQPDGKPSREVAKIEKAQLAGQEATLVSLSGRYVAAPPGGGTPVDKPDQGLQAAIVPSPKGPYYFRMMGPESAVQAQAPQFRAALDSLKLE